MMIACGSGHKDVVQLLLYHSDPNIELNVKVEYGMTAFIWACQKGHKDVVQLLLDHSNRIELNARRDNSMTAFMWACFFGHKDVVKLLLECSEFVDINIPNNFLMSKRMKNLVRLHSKRVQK